jgi:NAD(P)-dependent dehydrogenase (short-subunit alcohol dehydrogenase family)
MSKALYVNRGVQRELGFASLLLSAGLASRSQFKKISPTAMALGGVGLALLLWPRGDTYRNQVVVITGGSRGLGFALAEELIAQGARVSLFARDPDELEEACRKLGTENVFTVACDVTQERSFDNALAETRAKFGRIDTVIHNAGSIAVAPFETLNDEDFRREMEIHLNASIYAVRLSRPYFHQNGGGRLVFVSSIGGKVGVPHMSSYSASKFALSGFADAVRAELAGENISVTAAYPGLMRTGSPKRAHLKGDQEKEFLWFAASDNIPVVSIPASSAARTILNAAADRQAEVLVGSTAKAAAFLRQFAPEVTALALNVMAALLPHGDSRTLKTGSEARGLFDSLPFLKPLRMLEKKAQGELNQQASEQG